MKDKGMWGAVAALLPPLIIAATGWFEAHREVETETRQKFAALDNYAEYIEDRMKRDAALERALQNCMALLPATARPPAEEPPEGLSPEEERIFRGLQDSSTLAERAPVDLDEVAEEFGYEQKMVNP